MEMPYFGSDIFEKQVVEQPIQQAPSTIINTFSESTAHMNLVEQTPTTPTNFLNKPSNIYSVYNVDSQQKVEVINEYTTTENVFELSIKESPVAEIVQVNNVVETKEEDLTFELNNRMDKTVETAAITAFTEDLSEEEEQRKRALERIQKLRNLSFNMNATDANTEFDNVPAYIRRNMELFGNTLTTVESFYGRTTVDKNEHNETIISTKNSFLDGNRPD
jgi:cell division protein FtsZ